MIKKFSEFVSEAAADMVGRKDGDEEVVGMEPRSKGERDFKAKHKTDKKKHPVAKDSQFDGTTKEVKEEAEEVQEIEEEVQLTEGVMDQLRDIVKTKGAASVKFSNGKKVKVDMQSASALTKLYDKVNDANKKKMEAQIDKSPEVMMKLLDLAMSGGKK